MGLWADEDRCGLAATGIHHPVLPAFLPEAAVSGGPYPLPDLRALNFVVHGFLGWGVASNLRLDTQAKGLGELLHAREVEVPAALVAGGRPAARLASA